MLYLGCLQRFVGQKPSASKTCALRPQPAHPVLHEVSTKFVLGRLDPECYAHCTVGQCPCLSGSEVWHAADCGSGQTCNSARVCATPVPTYAGVLSACNTTGQAETQNCLHATCSSLLVLLPHSHTACACDCVLAAHFLWCSSACW